MKGFILAAGEGTRLRPLTYEIPKPLITVGRIPILTYLVDLFFENGIDDIRIGIQKAHLEDFYKWKATYFPRQKIEFVTEEKPSGTFTPIAKNLDPEWFCEPIVVSNGDELKDIDLKEMVRWHFEKNNIATIGLVKVDNPQAYGVARLEDDKIIEFVEKPKNPPSSYINSGTYVLNPEIRNYYPKGATSSMVETDLFPKLAKEGKLHGYKLSGRWMDTGTFQRWEEAINNWNGKKNPN
ncbi:MAG: nucleotidyltransferase family protein [Patescibacteria group bacterium]